MDNLRQEPAASKNDAEVLVATKNGLSRAFELLGGLPADFMADGREDPLPQPRDVSVQN